MELLNARRQELLEQLVSALGLDGEAAGVRPGWACLTCTLSWRLLLLVANDLL